MNAPPGSTTKSALALPTRAPIRFSSTPTADLFCGLAPEVVESIMASGRIQRCTAGQVIYRAGEQPTHLYLLRSGALNYYRLTEDGQEVHLRRLGPGEAFGLLTLLSKPTAGYIGTAETVSESEIHVWDRQWARRFVTTHPELAENALRITLEYIRLYSNRHLALVSESAEDRLAGTLTRLGIRVGTPHPKGLEVTVTNRHLASLADIGPFTASRLLNKWERKGVLDKSRGKVVIRNPEKILS